MSDIFKRLEAQMPALLTEMRNDLTTAPLKREAVLLPASWVVYNGKGNELLYDKETHPELLSQFQILLNFGLVTDITNNSLPRYLISETLAAYLKGELQAEPDVSSPRVKGFTG